MMAQQARKKAEELDWRNIAPHYEAVYSELINKNLGSKRIHFDKHR